MDTANITIKKAFWPPYRITITIPHHIHTNSVKAAKVGHDASIWHPLRFWIRGVTRNPFLILNLSNMLNTWNIKIIKKKDKKPQRSRSTGNVQTSRYIIFVFICLVERCAHRQSIYIYKLSTKCGSATETMQQQRIKKKKNGVCRGVVHVIIINIKILCIARQDGYKDTLNVIWQAGGTEVKCGFVGCWNWPAGMRGL